MFNKIVAVDYTGIEEFVLEELNQLGNEVVMYNDFPTSEEEIILRAKDADALLVSWNTKITKNIIDQLSGLKYIGMCCTLFDAKSANVDIISAQAKNIPVKGVKDYGDEGVVEFIYSELIQLIKGLGSVQYKEEQIELGGLKLGIIGMGTLGKMVADAGHFFGMEVMYYNRTKKDVAYEYLELDQLLETCDIISMHLPRNAMVLNKEHFKLFGSNKILINTGLTPPFHTEDFISWLSNDNFAIFDMVSLNAELKEMLSHHPNIITSNKVSGFTKNARKRLAHKVIDNLKEVLDEM